MPTTFAIAAGYVFTPLPTEQLPTLQAELQAFGVAHGLRGLVLLATEGVNATVCGPADGVAAWQALVRQRFSADVSFRESQADSLVFRRWSVKVKPEIVGLKRRDVQPRGRHRHLTPTEWQAALSARDDRTVVIDARNDFEVAIGKFQGALDPGTRRFSDFPAAVERLGVRPDQRVLLYCTGGIRCEKALLALEERGYRDVWQLEGGILGYLEQFPHQSFEGECFVFDHRVAVDQQLQPSQRYELCDACGDPVAHGVTCQHPALPAQTAV
jgi:UPF0176 protein